MSECSTEYTKSSLSPEAIDKIVGSVVGEYVFVETGTNIGAGTQVALDAGFKFIYTMEKLERFYLKAAERFKDSDRVLTMHCDSPKGLRKICWAIQDPCFFWLDAHTPSSAPLWKEISIIKSRGYREDLIVIDDCRMMRKELDWGRDTTMQQILDDLKGYEITYVDSHNAKDDILVAQGP